MSISLQELLMGQKLEEMPKEHQENAKKVLEKINIVRAKYGKPMSPSSFYRSKQKQISIYKDKAAKKQNPFPDGIFDEKKVPMGSSHLKALAVDIQDANGELKKWCRENEKFLEENGIWLEHWEDTPTWVHFQIVPYGSWKKGKTIWFKP